MTGDHQEDVRRAGEIHRQGDPSRELKTLLADGLGALGLELTTVAQGRLLEYVALLEKWNRTYNLTAVRHPAQMVTRHLLDSLAVTAHVNGPRVLDMGTGAGLPGLPLALALSDLQFVLLDSSAKKIRFVRQAVSILQIENIETAGARLEHFRPPRKFDTLITRAVADIPAMLAASRHLCTAGGRFLIMKGRYPGAELAEIPASYEVADVLPLTVPGLGAQRHLVIIAPRFD